MIKTPGVRLVLAAILSLIGLGTSSAQTKQPVQICPPQEGRPAAPTYTVVNANHVPDPPPETFVTISVAPESFSHADMKALARRLSDDFCNEQNLTVYIFDDERIARNASIIVHGDGLFELKLRGTYFIDRATRREYIEFSTKPERPSRRVRINLDPAGTPKHIRTRARPGRPTL